MGTFYACQVIPMWATYLFGPQLLATFGMDSQNLSRLGAALISALFLLGCTPAMRLLETAGRRKTVIGSFALMAVRGAAVAVSRIGAAIGTYLVPVSLESSGTSTTMYPGGGSL